MQKLAAIRIDDTEKGFRVTGLIARQKNRGRVWSIDVDRADKALIRQWVEDREELRKKNEGS